MAIDGLKCVMSNGVNFVNSCVVKKQFNYIKCL